MPAVFGLSHPCVLDPGNPCRDDGLCSHVGWAKVTPRPSLFNLLMGTLCFAHPTKQVLLKSAINFIGRQDVFNVVKDVIFFAQCFYLLLAHLHKLVMFYG